MITTSARIGAIAALLFLGLASFAHASHTWGSYHWARTSNPFTVKLGDAVTTSWDSYLAAAAADWNASDVLDTTIVPTSQSPKTCRPTAGRGIVCNSKYGANGWLGIAQIYVSSGHITAGSVKLNDTYFNTSSYNKPEWKQLVTCQEVGHIFGMGHQDETFANANLGSCMDYTNSPLRDDGAGDNQHPNAHDYELLASIYSHLDSSTTLSQTSLKSGQFISDDPRAWGAASRASHGRTTEYVKDLGDGNLVVTEVFWVGEEDHHEE